MNLKDMNGVALEELGQSAAAYCINHLGYTSASFDYIQIDGMDEVRVSIFVEDDFQQKLDYNARVQHGSIYFRAGTADELWDTLCKKHTREQRELLVAIGLFEQVGKDAGAMKSALLREEIARFTAKLDELKITALPAP